MEANTPYALYDNDGTQPMQWAAHIRLTPELLQKLQQNPEQVTLQLNANSGVTRRNSKKTSVLSVEMGGDGGDRSGLVQYELHAFQEDPRVNYLCTFREEHTDSDNAGGGDDKRATNRLENRRGYSIYKTGNIYQKLIVQRMLDSTEKDRMKDRHAQSVIESRSRTSKLLEEKPQASAKRRRVSLFPGSSTRSDTASTSGTSLQKFSLPSALSPEEAQQTKEKIEKGFEKNASQIRPPARPDAHEAELKESATTTQTKIKQRTRGTKEITAATLFSSDTDGDDADEGADDDMKSAKEAAPTAKGAQSQLRSAREANTTPPSKDKTHNDIAAVATPEIPTTVPSTAESTPIQSLTEPKVTQPTAPTQLPKLKRQPVASETKRPLPRASRIPDLSFFPAEVGQICKRISAYNPRSVILDDADYDAFVQQYEHFHQDWETLDKAYSVAIINIEGLHLQLEFATDELARSDLETQVQANGKKKEFTGFPPGISALFSFVLFRFVVKWQKRSRRSTRQQSKPQQASASRAMEGGDASSMIEPPFIARVTVSIRRKWQHLLDKSTIHVMGRWMVAAALLLTYLLRVFYLNAFHIVTYGLGIYLLNLFIGFLSPQIDAETEGPLLPSKQSEEFRPFTRRVPEFQFWYSTSKATFISLLMTLSSAFDVPVFWPILLIYFIALFTLTMKRQIKHMWKHNYVPWSHGKQTYKGKSAKNSK
ncbi:Protein rer1a, partial [Globisporangium splendens]